MEYWWPWSNDGCNCFVYNAPSNHFDVWSLPRCHHLQGKFYVLMEICHQRIQWLGFVPISVKIILCFTFLQKAKRTGSFHVLKHEDDDSECDLILENKQCNAWSLKQNEIINYLISKNNNNKCANLLWKMLVKYQICGSIFNIACLKF